MVVGIVVVVIVVEGVDSIFFEVVFVLWVFGIDGTVVGIVSMTGVNLEISNGDFSRYP